MKKQIINFDSFAKGELAKQFNTELQKVLQNVADTSTDPKKARKITVTMTVKSDDNRQVSDVTVQTKSTLAPAREIEAQLVLNYDSEDVTAAELLSGIPGQTFIAEGGEIVTDTGKHID